MLQVTMLLVVCKLSSDVFGYEDSFKNLHSQPTGAFQSALLLNSRLLLVKWSVIISHYSVVVRFV